MGTELRRKISKSKVLGEIKNILFVIIGCSILAFADAAFLTPGNIISGGVVSVGIIAQYYYHLNGVNWFFGLSSINDAVVTFVQIILWVIGWFTLGKKFSLNTLVASVTYPLIYALLFRFNIGGVLGLDALFDGEGKTAELMLAGIFGGALAGAGVAISYLGNGSTGGFDIISFIIAKYSEMKQDVSGFIIDASLILIGMLCMRDAIQGLIGILAALACAIAVQYIYVNADTFVIVDILSDKYEDIQDYIHKDMDHATTVIDTIGGYTGEKRKMIRVVIYQVETAELRSKIAELDPKAFVSFTQAKTINGEGFEPFIVPKKPSLHRNQNHEAQYDAERMAEEAQARAKKQKSVQKATPSSQKPALLPSETDGKTGDALAKTSAKAITKPAEKTPAKAETKPAEAKEDGKADKGASKEGKGAA
jgi:uncharacterized membrane-anchored protein YitT (DUF2179 family)